MISLTALLLGAACIGCGEAWQAETYPASGKVTVNGQPADGAVVTLVPTGEKVDVRNSEPWGIVDSDGSFQLQTYEEADGAPPGEYSVTIRWPWDVKQLDQAMSDRLGHAYSKPEQSEWQVTITEGENTLEPINIDGVEIKERPPGDGAAGPPAPGIATEK